MDEHFAHGVEYGRYVQFHRQKNINFTILQTHSGRLGPIL